MGGRGWMGGNSPQNKVVQLTLRKLLIISSVFASVYVRKRGEGPYEDSKKTKQKQNPKPQAQTELLSLTRSGRVNVDFGVYFFSVCFNCILNLIFVGNSLFCLHVVHKVEKQ